MSRRPWIAAALAVAAVLAIVGGAAALSHHGADHPSAASPTSTSSSPSDSPSATRSSGHLVPATSRYPTAGVCGRATGAVLTIRIEPDTPNPRCASVTAHQRLRVVNSTGDYGAHAHPVTVVWLPGRPFTLRPGAARTFPRQFGTYLARGVHPLKAGTAYRAEVWLH
jgi:hypothetical protein